MRSRSWPRTVFLAQSSSQSFTDKQGRLAQRALAQARAPFTLLALFTPRPIEERSQGQSERLIASAHVQRRDQSPGAPLTLRLADRADQFKYRCTRSGVRGWLHAARRERSGSRGKVRPRPRRSSRVHWLPLWAPSILVSHPSVLLAHANQPLHLPSLLPSLALSDAPACSSCPHQYAMGLFNHLIDVLRVRPFQCPSSKSLCNTKRWSMFPCLLLRSSLVPSHPSACSFPHVPYLPLPSPTYLLSPSFPSPFPNLHYFPSFAVPPVPPPRVIIPPAPSIGYGVTANIAASHSVSSMKTQT